MGVRKVSTGALLAMAYEGAAVTRQISRLGGGGQGGGPGIPALAVAHNRAHIGGWHETLRGIAERVIQQLGQPES